ncbi:MAG: hypothetical protein PHQ28_12725, partial [Mycobacterium sp.]|nr:hypothetical protein [Mycobacterium sp.]
MKCSVSDAQYGAHEFDVPDLWSDSYSRIPSLTDFLGASLAIYGGVSPSGVSAGVARRSEWSGLAVDVLLDDR